MGAGSVGHDRQGLREGLASTYRHTTMRGGLSTLADPSGTVYTSGNGFLTPILFPLASTQ